MVRWNFSHRQKWSELQRKNPMDSGALQIINVSMPREALYERADARILQMMEDGWLDETKRLLTFLTSVGVDAAKAKTLPSMSALGYGEMIDVALGQLSLADAITRIKADTRRFIRMQDAWFRPYWK